MKNALLILVSSLLAGSVLGASEADPVRDNTKHYFYRLADGTPAAISSVEVNGETRMALQVADAIFGGGFLGSDERFSLTMTDPIVFSVPHHIEFGQQWCFGGFEFVVVNTRTLNLAGRQEQAWVIERRDHMSYAHFVWSEDYGLVSFSLPVVELAYVYSTGQYEEVLVNEGYWLEELPGIGVRQERDSDRSGIDPSEQSGKCGNVEAEEITPNPQ